MKNCFVLILLLLILNFNALGQSRGHGQKESKESSKIALTDILGDWYPVDSLNPKISFNKIGNTYVEIEGIKHGVGNYGFDANSDSMDVNGLAVNWPPYNCTLFLKGRNVLEIEFYQFHLVEKYSIFYKRQ